MIQKCDGVKILDLEEKLEVTGSEYMVTAEKGNNYKLPLESVADIVIGSSKFKAAIKEYINSKTNSILKTNILRNNRDVVATIVYNELTDLLEFSNTSSVTTPIDSEILKRYLHQVKPQLYSGIPMKLKPYCIKCGCGNGYFRGLYDPYVLALLTEDADPWLWEDNGVVLLEQQKENNLIDNDSKN